MMNMEEYSPKCARYIKDDGTISNLAEQAVVTGEKSRFRGEFEALNANEWIIVQSGAGHSVGIEGDAAGSKFLKIGVGLTPNTETILLSKEHIKLPLKIGAGVSLSQRILGQEFAIELVAVDDEGNVISETPRQSVEITSITRVSNVVTVTTPTPHNFKVGDRVCIEKVVSTTFMGGSYVITSTPSLTTFTFNQTAVNASSTGGIAVLSEPLGNANAGAGFLWDGTSASNAIYTVKAGGVTPLVSNSTAFTTTAAIVPFAGQPQFLTGSVYEILANSDFIGFASYIADSQSAATYAKRSQNLPSQDMKYKIRIRAKNLTNISRRVGKIASISRSSNVVTVTTDVAHNLAVGNTIGIIGVQDQTNFANAAGIVITGVTSNTFTYSSTGTAASSLGGFVYVATSGGGSNSFGITNIARANNRLTITTNTAHGYVPGLTVELNGVNSAPDIDGRYTVLSVPTTTTLTLESSGADIPSKASGGGITAITDFRIHFVKASVFTKLVTEVIGSSFGRVDANSGVPVNIGSNGSVTVIGTASHDAAIWGNPVRIGTRALTSNYAAVSSGDTADLISTLVGALIQKPYSIPELDWQYQGSAITNTTDVVLKTAAASGIRNYLTCMQYINTVSTATEVVVKDGTTVIWRGYAPANMANVIDIQFPTPLKGTVATALNFACITSGSNTYINAQGYQAP